MLFSLNPKSYVEVFIFYHMLIYNHMLIKKILLMQDDKNSLDNFLMNNERWL